MRALILPLAIYLGMTIGVPFLDGAWREPGFVEHALVVLGLALAVVGGVAASRCAWRAYRSNFHPRRT